MGSQLNVELKFGNTISLMSFFLVFINKIKFVNENDTKFKKTDKEIAKYLTTNIILNLLLFTKEIYNLLLLTKRNEK